MSDHFGMWKLDKNKRPVRCKNILEWAEWYEQASANNADGRRVAETITEFHRISTVFLGLDHQWGKGPPILFETMVFETAKTLWRMPDGSEREINEEMPDQTFRYASWSDAEAGHAATVRRVLKREATAAKAAQKAGCILVKKEIE